MMEEKEIPSKPLLSKKEQKKVVEMHKKQSVLPPKLPKSEVQLQKREKQEKEIRVSDAGAVVLGSVEKQDVAVGTGSVSTGALQKNRANYKNELRLLERQAKRDRRRQKHASLKQNLSVIGKVFKYSKRNSWLLWISLIVDLLATLFELAIPVVLGTAVDCLIGKGSVDFSKLLDCSFVMGTLVLLSAGAKWVENVTLNVYCVKTSKTIRDLMFDKLNRVPLSVIDNSQHGDLMDRMVDDIDAMTNGFLGSFASVLGGITTIIGTIVFMFLLNIQLALVVVFVTPLSLFITMFIAKKSRTLYHRMAKQQGDLCGHMEEYISGQRVVKAFNHENKAIQDYEKINKDFYVAGEKAQFLARSLGPITRFVNGLVYGLVGLFGAVLAIKGRLSIGVITTFLTYSNSYGKPFSEISDEIAEIQVAFAAGHRVFEILEKTDEPSDENLPELEVCDGNVKLENVFFSYVPKQKLIQDLNLDVKPGQKIAIVGPTGCGKTTLINLLMRFYDTTSGIISVSNQNVKEIKRSSLRTKYGMVLQESWMFAGTVFDNIAYGKTDATEEEVIDAAKRAGAHEFIMKMKNGYKTQIEEGGSNVSQGQKQLLCISRIMLCKPSMLILDEATSNIDTATELKIQKAFNEMMKGKTAFVVAHRLSTIVSSDLILVMNKGNVIEKGTHDELIEKHGFYFQLYNSQFS